MANWMDKLKQMWNTPDDEYEYDDKDEEKNAKRPEEPEDDEEYYEEESSFASKESPRIPFIGSQNSNKVVNINTTTKLQVVLFKPDRFSDETRAIADELMKQHTIVLNLENTNKDNSRRIIDFLSGAAYASRGKIKRVATSTFLIIPSSVGMTGDDLLDQLESSGVYF
ncbi:MAG: cell division protein SepF [Clostridia bacterium]|nr:cell division protein SepF [Clostridia bacterium]